MELWMKSFLLGVICGYLGMGLAWWRSKQRKKLKKLVELLKETGVSSGKDNEDNTGERGDNEFLIGIGGEKVLIFDKKTEKFIRIGH